MNLEKDLNLNQIPKFDNRLLLFCNTEHRSVSEIELQFARNLWLKPNMQKRDIFQQQNWMMQMVFSAWGIQTGLFAACRATFVLKRFQLFHFYTGQPILITPEG